MLESPDHLPDPVRIVIKCGLFPFNSVYQLVQILVQSRQKALHPWHVKGQLSQGTFSSNLSRRKCCIASCDCLLPVLPPLCIK